MKDFFRHNGILILVVAFLLAAVLAVASALMPAAPSLLGNALGVVTAPLRSGVNAVSGWFQDLYDRNANYDALVEENQQLKQEIAKLQEEAQESLRQRPFIFFHHDTPLHSDIPYYAPVQACLNERSAYGSEAARYRRDEKRTPLRQPPLGGAAGRDGPEAPLLRLRTRGHGPPPKAGEKYQTHDHRGGIDMRPKWTRYLAMGVALLLAVLMLATLIVPYLSL